MLEKSSRSYLTQLTTLMGQSDHKVRLLLKNTIEVEKDKLINAGFNNFDQACKYMSIIVSEELRINRINNNILNLTSILKDFMFEHQFVIANYKNIEGKIKHLLIDPTFAQFHEKKGEKRNKDLPVWPGSEIIKTVEGHRINEELNKNGFTEINENGLNTYLSCFTTEQTDYSFDNLIHKSINIVKKKNF